MFNSITEQLKKNRPSLSQSSLNTYKSNLSTLYRTIHPESKDDPIEFFCKEHNMVIKNLKQLPLNTRKLKLAGLVSLTSHEPKVCRIYQDMMMNDIKQYDAEIREQKKSLSQQENWLSQDQVRNLHDNLRESTAYLFKKQTLTPKERSLFQDYLILSLYVLQPPRRIQDYTEMLLNSTPADGEDFNYIKNKKFFFQKYKTAKRYGEQIVDINPKLYYIIQKWRKINPNQKWLIVGETGDRLTSPAMTMRLNKIFGGKKISVNMLRHIYITDELKDVPALTKLDKTAEAMGHSTDTAMLYKKV